MDPAHNLADTFCQKFSKHAMRVSGFENLYDIEIELQGDQDGMAGMMPDPVFTIPGMDEAMRFAEIMKRVQSIKYSVIIFDTAPTSHALRFLSFPSIFENAIEKLSLLSGHLGPIMQQFGSIMGLRSTNADDMFGKLNGMRALIAEVNGQLKDPDLTTFVCVCISESWSLHETARLIQALTSYKFGAHCIVVNQLLYPKPNTDCDQCNTRYKMQWKYLTEIRNRYMEEFHVVPMPLLTEELRGVKSITNFSKMLIAPVLAQQTIVPKVGESSGRAWKKRPAAKATDSMTHEKNTSNETTHQSIGRNANVSPESSRKTTRNGAKSNSVVSDAEDELRPGQDNAKEGNTFSATRSHETSAPPRIQERELAQARGNGAAQANFDTQDVGHLRHTSTPHVGATSRFSEPILDFDARRRRVNWHELCPRIGPTPTGQVKDLKAPTGQILKVPRTQTDKGWADNAALPQNTQDTAVPSIPAERSEITTLPNKPNNLASHDRSSSQTPAISKPKHINSHVNPLNASTMTSISQMGSANNFIPNSQQLASISKATSNEMEEKHTTQARKVDGNSFQANRTRRVNEADENGLANEVNGIGVQEGRKRKRTSVKDLDSTENNSARDKNPKTLVPVNVSSAHIKLQSTRPGPPKDGALTTDVEREEALTPSSSTVRELPLFLPAPSSSTVRELPLFLPTPSSSTVRELPLFLPTPSSSTVRELPLKDRKQNVQHFWIFKENETSKNVREGNAEELRMSKDKKGATRRAIKWIIWKSALQPGVLLHQIWSIRQCEDMRLAHEKMEEDSKNRRWDYGPELMEKVIDMIEWFSSDTKESMFYERPELLSLTSEAIEAFGAISKPAFKNCLITSPQLLQVNCEDPFFQQRIVRLDIIKNAWESTETEKVAYWKALGGMMIRTDENPKYTEDKGAQRILGPAFKKLHSLSVVAFDHIEKFLGPGKSPSSPEHPKSDTLLVAGEFLIGKIRALQTAVKSSTRTSAIRGPNGLMILQKRIWETLLCVLMMQHSVKFAAEKGRDSRTATDPNRTQETAENSSTYDRGRSLFKSGDVGPNPTKNQLKEWGKIRLSAFGSMAVFFLYGVAGWWSCLIDPWRFNQKDVWSIVQLAHVKNKWIYAPDHLPTQHADETPWYTTDSFVRWLLRETNMACRDMTQIDWEFAPAFWAKHVTELNIARFALEDILNQVCAQNPLKSLNMHGKVSPDVKLDDASRKEMEKIKASISSGWKSTFKSHHQSTSDHQQSTSTHKDSRKGGAEVDLTRGV
ncbi:Golgi to ER traffic- protein [Puccinia graminis f. sp. tritici]|uniref:Golgi to ER traffic-protein n=1 Tax=Puccinia graminis f. sp. tritici TaxID=56615 RepID=A0A5B0M1Y4_PUCGR|nr:Golgi to ER traffic- protein [Puccinia graminis f. sp. tritici]